MIDDRDVWAAALLKVKRYDAMLLPAPASLPPPAVLRLANAAAYLYRDAR
jgi:hypothetical protein